MNNYYIQYPDNAKVWIYQSDRHFNEDEKKHIQISIDDFIDTWESHGNMVKGTFTILYDAFIVLFVDEQGDTMCGRTRCICKTNEGIRTRIRIEFVRQNESILQRR